MKAPYLPANAMVVVNEKPAGEDGWQGEAFNFHGPASLDEVLKFASNFDNAISFLSIELQAPYSANDITDDLLEHALLDYDCNNRPQGMPDWMTNHPDYDDFLTDNYINVYGKRSYLRWCA